jgi:5'-phosphate synthase pdxT subunit
MTFIRAPYIEEVLSHDCHVLSEVDGHVVAALQGNQLATSFHPELDDDTRLHEYFCSLIGNNQFEAGLGI